MVLPATGRLKAAQSTNLLRAAESAGYRNVTMLEEPQAAFYAWIERHKDWRERDQ